MLFHMRQMEEAWNIKIYEKFNPSWINVLGESMKKWFNKYAPRFMSIGIKLHPSVN